MNGVMPMTLALPPFWPCRGHTIIATGDQRKPVVMDKNTHVPAGGEQYLGSWRASVVRPLRGRRWSASAHHGFRSAPPVAITVCPLRGQERAGQSGNWRVQEWPTTGGIDTQPDKWVTMGRIPQRGYGAKPGVGRSRAKRDENLPRVTGTPILSPYPEGVVSADKRAKEQPLQGRNGEGGRVTQGSRPAPLRSASRQPWAVLHNPVGVLKAKGLNP